jgi:hypothetical protein
MLEIKELTSLSEEILQVLPAYIEWELFGDVSKGNLKMRGVKKGYTNVGHVNLPTASSSGGSAKASLLVTTKVTWSSSSTGHSTAKVASCGSWVGETRLGLSVFANVYESSHEVLITERRHGILSLLPSCIFHNATSLCPSKSQSTTVHHANEPAIICLPLTFHSEAAIRLRIRPRRL